MHPKHIIDKSQMGQGGLIILIALISTGILSFSVAYMMSQSHQDAVQYNLADKNSLSAYYYAQSGIQEALGTRFVPASNCLNFEKRNYGGGLTFYPYRTQSGRVSSNGDLVATSNTPKATQGLYRYIVKLKANPAVINYANPDTSVGFYIYSEGAICVNPKSQKIDPSGVMYQNNQPMCPSGSANLLKMPIRADITLKQLSANTSSTITAANQNKINQSVRITSQEFQDVWHQECDGAARGPAPIKYIIGLGAPQDWKANITKADSNKAITLIFDKPIDYRTLSGIRIYPAGNTTNNLNNPSKLLVSINYKFVETGNTLTIYPSIEPSLFSNKKYDLYLSGLKGYNGLGPPTSKQKMTFEYD
ncbi:hypothetical protein [Vampirovibrio sp.]|uniref:hypothetical protein n=1 Tax=Vampirovibrio sp. TaxID=2717857 RepID=UPI0035937656